MNDSSDIHSLFHPVAIEGSFVVGDQAEIHISLFAKNVCAMSKLVASLIYENICKKEKKMQKSLNYETHIRNSTWETEKQCMGNRETVYVNFLRLPYCRSAV
jgi:hypothetical protein